MNGESSYSVLLRQLAGKYRDMPIDNVIAAFGRTSMNAGFTGNPYVQNRRIKAISSLPINYEYDKVAEMLTKPNENEQPLREVSHVLESTVAPYWKIRKTYQGGMDYALYSEFESKEALAAYAVHPLHLAAKDKFHHMLASRVAADYEI